MKGVAFFLSCIVLISAASYPAPSPKAEKISNANLKCEMPRTDSAAKILTDAEFLTEASNCAQFEIKASKLALRMSLDKKVRKFASYLIQDCEASNKLLAALLVSRGHTVPLQLTGELQSRYKYLTEWMGTDFEKRYVADNVDVTNQAIALYKNQALHSNAADIRQLGNTILQQLELRSKAAQVLSVHVNNPPASGW